MLSKATEYAIRALVYVMVRNNKGTRPGFKEIATETGSPEQFTAKVLQILTKNGLLRSLKGRGGGFFFNDPSRPLSLFEVINLMEGPGFFKKCGFGLKNCDSEHPCPMHDEYILIRDTFYQLAGKTSIQALATRVTANNAFLRRD